MSEIIDGNRAQIAQRRTNVVEGAAMSASLLCLMHCVALPLLLLLLPGQAEGGETLFTVVGSVMLVAGHMMNWRLRARSMQVLAG